MTDYDIVYIDDRGDKQEFVVTSVDTRSAIKDLYDLCPDAKRIIRCTPKPKS